MKSPPGGLEPPTFRLTAERASQLRHGGMCLAGINISIDFHFDQYVEVTQQCSI